MTIKEVEQVLNIPRATVRFYEKEGLIEPEREGNRYRNYSEDDVDKLKKVIILRKIGIAVTDIEDIFDGAKQMPEVLVENSLKLEKQMEELKGAMIVCQRMQKERVTLSSFDASDYWNFMEEEEKKGHTFMDIAKDIAQMEKRVISSYFSWTDINGEIYASASQFIRDVLIAFAVSGCMYCLMNKRWSLENFAGGVLAILSCLLVECFISIPIHFIGKRFAWVEKNRTKCLLISCLVLCAVLIVLGNVGR